MRVNGLYVITDPMFIPEAGLIGAVVAAIAGGARTVQYRDKTSAIHLKQEQAASLAELCRRHQVTFIVNDDPELACAVEADGVHLGRDDPKLNDARGVVGKGRIIGVSCYNELDRAQAAREQGADYVTFGSFFSSTIKPQAAQASPDLLREAKQTLTVPVVAIGGITPENGAALVAAGADALAVISGVFGATDITAAAQAYAQLFQPQI